MSRCVPGCTLSKIITVIDVSIHLVSEVYESNRVIVTLEWTQIGPFHFYNVSVIPSQSVEVVSRGSTIAQLTLSYSTPYNVSVVARHLCEQTCGVTNFTELYYSRLTHAVKMLIYL